MNTVNTKYGAIAYQIFGESSKLCMVIETAMGSSCAEWWHLAQEWSKHYMVLVYDRLGYGQSDKPKLNREPKNIANELNELLLALEIKATILIGHSLGGLYAYHFTKMFPKKVKMLVLLDPVSPENNRFENELSKEEFKKSGVDKSANLKLGKIICSLGMGGLLKPFLRKSPPFYYYNNFIKEAEKYILKNLTSKKMYKTAINEYSYIKDSAYLSQMTITSNSLDIPLILICHTPENMKKEIEYYGNTDKETSEKIERIWVDIMKEYLKLTKKSNFYQAKNSGHYIHLSDPNIILEAIVRAASASNSE